MSDLDNNQQYQGFEEETPPGGPSGSNNRTFLIAVGIIAGLFLLAVIGLVVYLLLFAGPQNTASKQQATLISAENIATSAAATKNAFAAQLALTPSDTWTPTATQPATSTPVIVQPTDTQTPLPTDTPTPGAVIAQDLTARTQTVAALLTQAAGGGTVASATPGGTPTALPTTGFADEVGLPGLIGLAVVLLAVIFLARRMRSGGNS
ncbi:MAG TPA: LPXTG cell wall anchor domain-containing protein [Anaerolineaceae bacterium]|nr:LPXTG cell wall anchor domain-containing protein [Anaerolineaceae bacterium]